MREHDSLTRLLATHARTGEDDRDRGARSRHASLRGSTRFLDDEAKARILDASLGVLAALRNLADVTEEILRDRRDSLLARGGGGSERTGALGSTPSGNDDSHNPDDSHTRRGVPPREQIPLTY